MFFTDKRVEPSLRNGKSTESMNTSTVSSFRNIVTESRAILAALVLVLFTACGESTTEKIVEVAANSTEIVSSVKDLPKCTKDNAGEQVWVKDENGLGV